jgi:hypothetical protein
MLLMLFLQWWKPLLITLAAESLIALCVLVIIAEGHRLEYFVKGIIVAPIRYLPVMFDVIIIGRFMLDLWVFGNRSWRK